MSLHPGPLPDDEGARLRALLAPYHPQAGTRDEMMGPDRQPRAHWQAILGAMARAGQVGLAQAFALADRHQRDAGVTYRIYDSGSSRERAWPLSHVPLVLPQAEWTAIEAAMRQRADLLERVLDDVYGEGRLSREGRLPGRLVAASPDYLRPLAGIPPRGGRRLHVYAADLGRAPDGGWWVLGDRAQAPSGMGFALENRIALSRALPEIYGGMNVRRLAPFFQSWRDGLAALTAPDGSRVGLLTPGPLNETAFEHAYLARYLGFVLVEGGDLVVRDGALHVRTVGGLRRMDVLVRRLDSEFADPLELDPASRLGVPGLVQAVRAGTVTLANALGSGILESPGLMAFLPALAPHLAGAPLAMPNVATWWLGDETARREALARIDDLVLRPASNRRDGWRFGPDGARVAELDPAARQQLLDAVARRPGDFVAQEAPPLATMPVWRAGRLEARPFTLRVFVVATQEGWAVMPGGFCRVGEDADERAVSMQRGGRAADVWILGEERVEPATLLPPPGAVTIRRAAGALPSRAAENLFWLGRHLERAEATLRVVRALAGLAVENTETFGPGRDALVRLAELLAAWGAAPPPAPPARGSALRAAESAACDAGLPGSAVRLVEFARRNAAELRDRLSADTLHTLADLAGVLGPAGTQPPGPGPLVQRAEDALRVVAAFSGHVQETMNRLSGWRFLEVGRRVERGIVTARLVRRLADEAAPASCLDALLDVTDSQTTYRARYMFGALREPVLDLVVADEANPRALGFQAARLGEHVQAMAGLQPLAREGLSPVAAEIAGDLAAAEPGRFAPDVLVGIENRLMELSNALTRRFFLPTEHHPAGAEEVP